MDQESVAATSQYRQEGEETALALDAALVQLRRQSDWTGQPRAGDEVAEAAYRAALNLATATLAAHDDGTASHSDDVTTLCIALGEQLGVEGRDRAYLLAAAELHDIGKVGIPAEVLTKPSELDSREWDLMREHTITGERILGSVPELTEVARIVRHCHERWDGKGYPDGIAGEQIPLAARIVFCADAFHAIRDDRPYRPGRSARVALAEIRCHSGAQFDPAVVEALGTAALQVRDHRRRKLVLLMGGRRSQRLAALLLTLAIGTGAMAVTGVWRAGDGRANGSDGADRTPTPRAEPDPRPVSAAAASPAGRDRPVRRRGSGPGKRAAGRKSPHREGTGALGAPAPQERSDGPTPATPAPPQRQVTSPAEPPDGAPALQPRPAKPPRPTKPPASVKPPMSPKPAKPAPLPPVVREDPPPRPALTPAPVEKEKSNRGNGYGHLKGVGKHLGHEH